MVYFKLLSDINIGIVGHVDHGKTTLTQTITKKWADTHSEEMKRGITIRLGYADAIIYFCNKCKVYSTTPKCSKCFEDCEAKRMISIIDAPGHETLMATVLSGASIMDAAILVIAANEKCPQPQTAEHLKVLDIIGIKNIIIVQNKIDLIAEEQARKNYEEIKNFVKGTVAENSPIIPVSAVHMVNMDVLLEKMYEIPSPERDETKNPKFYIARSFDINRPGTEIEKLNGGVIGGSVTQGVFKKGDVIEIKPGVNAYDKWIPLKSSVNEIIKSNENVDKAGPGGLVALKTDLDPSVTKGDILSGNICGIEGKMPPVWESLKTKPNLFDYVIGTKGQQKVEKIKTNEVLMLTVGITKTVGVVSSVLKNTVEIKLKLPVCADKNDKIAVSRQVSGRWHLIGWGEII